MKWIAILMALLACATIAACQSRDLPTDREEEDSVSTAQPDSSEDEEEDIGDIILPADSEEEEPEIGSSIVAPPASEPATSKPAASASQSSGGQGSTSASPYLVPIQALLGNYKEGGDFAPLPSGYQLPKVGSASDFSIANQADWGTGGSLYEFIATIPMDSTMIMTVGLNKINGQWTAVGADFIALA